MLYTSSIDCNHHQTSSIRARSAQKMRSPIALEIDGQCRNLLSRCRDRHDQPRNHPSDPAEGCQREFTSADVLVPPSPAQGAPVLAGRGRSGERRGSVAGERDLFFVFVKRSRVARALAAVGSDSVSIAPSRGPMANTRDGVLPPSDPRAYENRLPMPTANHILQ
jgi:hypothetical protein